MKPLSPSPNDSVNRLYARLNGMQLTSNGGNKLASRDINFYKLFIQGPSGKSNKAVHSEKRDGERLSRVILNLGMLSEVICNRFTEDAYLPRVVCTVFGFTR